MNYYVWDNGFESNYKEDQSAAREAVVEATKDGRYAYIFQK